MPNEWKVLTRVIERNSVFEFSDEGYDRYMSAVADAYSKALLENNGSPEEESKYHSFLIDHVLSDESVIEVLKEEGVPVSLIDSIRDGTIDLNEAIDTWNEIRFTLDELIDFLMLLKLVRDYSAKSDSMRIESRYRLQKLAYLVNQDLLRQQDSSASENNFGLLSKTGYRYRYSNRQAGPYSEEIYEDKNRLFAWKLLDEPVAGDEGTGEVAERNRRYGIELSAQGEIMVERFYDRIENSDSFIISAWNHTQKQQARKVASMSHSELENHVSQKEDVLTTPDGGELLIGPRNKFQETQIEFLDELRGEFANA